MDFRNLSGYLTFLFLLSAMVWTGCGRDQKRETVERTEKKQVDVPDFNEDSAYYFVKKQVSFGPRVPNTAAHEKAAAYFVNTFKSYGANVEVQEFEATTFDNTRVTLKNIIASFDPDKTKRILLAAHWDTRPFADKDAENPQKPIDGADDGASGVAVLLEIARVLSLNEHPDVGIDIILFDGEDWGELENGGQDTPLPNDLESWWCLGSQYWSKNKHDKGYSAYYGILLDMVGAKNAKFAMEGASMYYARSVVEKIWDRAAELGYSNYFIRKQPGGITDDHVFVNKYAKIPMVDIVHFDPEHGFFGKAHHTHEDNMKRISPKTLEAVGQTVLSVIYYE